MLVRHLTGEDLTTKLDSNEFGGGRHGIWNDPDDIRRFMCSVQGCGRRAESSWSGCADQNINRPLCPEHDIQINLLALLWWGDPEWHEKIMSYVEKINQDVGRHVEHWCYDETAAWQMMEDRVRDTSGSE